MAITIRDTVVTGFFSVVVAAITTWGALHASSSGINENSQKLAQLKQEASNLSNPGIPVGTIVASILTREQFAKAAGDPANFSIEKSKWALADGGSVDGTDYSEATNKTRLPDLQGVFLRGQNNGHFPGIEEVTLGDYRPDNVGSHTHQQLVHRNAGEGGNASNGGGAIAGRGGIDNEANADLWPDDQFLILQNKPGGENLPKNVTVNYYIRINK